MAGEQTGLVLYHADWGRSCRAIWLLRELQIPFTLRSINWMKIKDKQFMEEICPLGRVPVLFDGTSCIYESGAIVQYLLEKYSQGDLTVSHGTCERAEFLQWFDMAETVGMNGVKYLYFEKVMPDGFPRKSEEKLQGGVQQTRAFLQELEKHLGSKHRGQWVAGSKMTAADIMISYTLGLMTFSTIKTPQNSNVAPQVLTAEEFPVVTEYWERMQSLPGYKDCYENINFLPFGDHHIEPGMNFEGKGTRQPTIF